MRKTLYFDKESNDILEKMPPKKQSAFVREAIKNQNKKDMNPDEIPEQEEKIIRVRPTIKEVII